VDDCLLLRRAKSTVLAGQETVAGLPAWRVHVGGEYGARDLWIDTARPQRLLKVASAGEVILSTFDEANPQDPIPTEVTSTMLRNGEPAWQTRFVRSNARFGRPVDPELWTLAGLHMPVGTGVSDNRIMRRVGYWTGVGLSEGPFPKAAAPQTVPARADLLAILDNEPASPAALSAAQWLLLNTPDGPEVQKAAEVILQEHVADTNLLDLVAGLERMRPTCSRPLLEAMLEKNPSAEVRGNACLSLANLRKDAADEGRNKPAAAEAEKLYERVIADFGQVTRGGHPLAELAKPPLYELRTLTIGKPAPEIEGEDLDGHSLKLTDYRGKVVALVFWSAGCRGSELAPECRQLLERMSGKPFAVIGVHADDNTDRARAVAEELGMTWPSFADARHGPISTAWNVNSWPVIFVLDRDGLIRDRPSANGSLTLAVEKLLGK
jgi:peroxiredoxin